MEEIICQRCKTLLTGTVYWGKLCHDCAMYVVDHETRHNDITKNEVMSYWKYVRSKAAIAKSWEELDAFNR